MLPSITILILDDEELVRDVARMVLTKAGYRVLEASEGKEAMSISESHSGKIDLLLTNHRLLHGESGREVAERIRLARPEMKILHISGYPEKTLRNEGSLTPGGFYLGKPFLPDQLLAKVGEILGTPMHDSRR